MKTKFLVLLMLLIIAGSKVMTAQDSTHKYIPLLDTTNRWYTVKAQEFGGWFSEQINVDYQNNILNVNDTIYYPIQMYGGGCYCCYREDTSTQKVYYRGDSYVPEELIYDFSLKQGDSIKNEFNSWFYIDSVKDTIIINKLRKVYYLSCNDEHPIWIEGIGSLSSIVSPYLQPKLYWTGYFYDAYLTCCYQNDTLSFQNYYGNLYGCEFEKIDQVAPIILNAWFDPDTVANSKPVNLYFIATDDKSFVSGAYIEIISPNNNVYVYNNLEHIQDSLYKITIDTLQSPKFWNATGVWKLSVIVLWDTSGNYKAYYNSNASFFVSEILGINNSLNTEFQIYPNPVTENSILKFNNPKNGVVSISIYDIIGNELYETNTTQSNINIGKLIQKSGIYIVKINLNNQIITKKIIKL